MLRTRKPLRGSAASVPLRQIQYIRIVRSGTRRILLAKNIYLRPALLDDGALY